MNSGSPKEIFLDSNIIFSGIRPDTPTHQFLAFLREEGHRLVANPYVLEESRRNVDAKCPELNEELTALLAHIEIVPDAPLFHKIPLSEKDRPVLAAAVTRGSEFLLSGDRHFRHLRKTRILNTVIVAPEDLAYILSS